MVIAADIIALCGIVFAVYVSDYYHALPYTVPSNIMVSKYEDFTLYGDAVNTTGFIFYPGGKVEAKAYEPLMCELAEQGICCVLVKMPCNLAVLKPNAADAVLRQVSAVQEWYIGGHSLGGAMAASYAAKNPDKVRGLVLLGAYPTAALAEDFPVLAMTGSEDGVLNRSKYDEAKPLVPHLEEITIEGGNHAFFGNYGAQSGDGTASMQPKEQWRITAENIAESMRKDSLR